MKDDDSFWEEGDLAGDTFFLVTEQARQHQMFSDRNRFFILREPHPRKARGFKEVLEYLKRRAEKLDFNVDEQKLFGYLLRSALWKKSFRIEGSYTDIAAYTNLTIELVVAIFKEFEREKLLIVEG